MCDNRVTMKLTSSEDIAWLLFSRHVFIVTCFFHLLEILYVNITLVMLVDVLFIQVLGACTSVVMNMER